jgi:cytochrome c-type biogenesis protein CcmE
MLDCRRGRHVETAKKKRSRGDIELKEKPMKPRHKRIAMIAGGLAALAVAAGLVLTAFQQNLVFFFTPSQVAANEAPQGKTFRIGGVVETGSIQRQPDGLTVHFMVTDTARSIPVVYRGALPDLFREGKGVVAQGRIGTNGVFEAREVLAKHDENYMPPEAADAVQRAHEASRKAAQTVVGGER